MIYISFLLMLLYISYTLINVGIPNSLSATYYNFGWIFSIIISVSSLLVLPKALAITPETFQFLPFITIASILFVAFAPNFLSDNLVDRVHTVSAIISFITSQIWVALMNPIYLLFWIPILIYILIYYKTLPKIKFIAEIIMLLTIYCILL